jgi:hypothetical protein
MQLPVILRNRSPYTYQFFSRESCEYKTGYGLHDSGSIPKMGKHYLSASKLSLALKLPGLHTDDTGA